MHQHSSVPPPLSTPVANTLSLRAPAQNVHSGCTKACFCSNRHIEANLKNMIQVILQQIVPSLPIVRCSSIRLPEGRVVRHGQVILRVAAGAGERKAKSEPEASHLSPQQQVEVLQSLECRSMDSSLSVSPLQVTDYAPSLALHPTWSRGGAAPHYVPQHTASPSLENRPRAPEGFTALAAWAFTQAHACELNLHSPPILA